MNLPSYSITHLIVSYLIRFEVALEKINSTPLPKTHLKDLTTEAETLGIYNISQLIGSPIAQYKAEQIQKGHVIPTGNSPLLIFANYRSALEFSHNYKSINSIAPSTELLLHLNRILLRKIVEQWDAGKLREFSDKPIEIFDTWYKYRDYYPNTNLGEYIDSVLSWVHGDGQVHRLIRLAVLLFELIDKAPLQSGNQVTAVALLQSLSVEYNLNPNSLFSFSKAINYIAPDLEKAFKQAKSSKDLTVFIEAFLYTVSFEILNVEQKYLKTFDNKIKKGGKLREKFNTRQIRILEYLENVNRITREEYTKLMGTSFMTSYRDLQGLLNEGYISQSGVGRGTYYQLISKDTEMNIRNFIQKKAVVLGSDDVV